jgi:hypothetical protein
MEMNGASRYPSPLSKRYPLIDAKIKTAQLIAMRMDAMACRQMSFRV